MDARDKPPLGQYLERLRDSYTPRISIRGAAELAGLSEARWRQIESGYRVVAKGVRVTTEVPVDTVVQMVEALSGDAEELRNIGLIEAADKLAARYRRQFEQMEYRAGIGETLTALPDIALLAEVVRRALAPTALEPRMDIPELQLLQIMEGIRGAYLPSSQEDRDEERRRIAALGPETEYDPDHVLRRLNAAEAAGEEAEAAPLAAEDAREAGERARGFRPET